jgi:hypothetical protein
LDERSLKRHSSSRNVNNKRKRNKINVTKWSWKKFNNPCKTCLSKCNSIIIQMTIWTLMNLTMYRQWKTSRWVNAIICLTCINHPLKRLKLYILPQSLQRSLEHI